MDHSKLAALIQTHNNWPSVGDGALRTWCSDETAINRKHSHISPETMLGILITNRADLVGLSAIELDLVFATLQIPDGVPSKTQTPGYDELQALLGATSAIMVAVDAAAAYTISRAQRDGIDYRIKLEYIKKARAVATGG